MEAFLSHFGIEKLSGALQEEGIDDPSAFADLEAEDIAEFIRECAQSKGLKLTLGDKSKLRKAWKQVKTGGWKGGGGGGGSVAPVGAATTTDTKKKGGDEEKPSKDILNLLTELKIEAYAQEMSKSKHWSQFGGKPSVQTLIDMTKQDRTTLLLAINMKPGHRLKLERHLSTLKATLPKYICDMKVSDVVVGKGCLGLGTKLGEKNVSMAFLGEPVTKGVGMYPKAKGGAKALFVIPKGTPSGALAGGVALNDSQKGRMLGKGVLFRIRMTTNNSIVWASNHVSAKGSKQEFFFAWSEEKLGNLVQLEVVCDGLNVNAPAMWIDPRIILGQNDAPKPVVQPEPPVKKPGPVPPPPFPIDPPGPMPRPYPHPGGGDIITKRLLRSGGMTNGYLHRLRRGRDNIQLESASASMKEAKSVPRTTCKK